MPTDAKPAEIVRVLLRTARQGGLATLMPDGSPYCSWVAVASHPDGSPILLISRLAVHTMNLLGDSRVSLLLQENAKGDLLQNARVMVSCSAEEAASKDSQLLRRRYLAAHPSAELFVDFPDFLFVRLRMAGIHLVAGFGRIADIGPAAVLTDIGDARDLIAAEESAVEHLNDDHSDALSLYATKLLGAAEGKWRCTGLDPDGLDLAAGDTALRLDFPERVTNPAALRRVLVKLASAARGEPAPPH